MSFSLDSLVLMAEEKRKELEDIEAAIRLMKRLTNPSIAVETTIDHSIDGSGLIDITELEEPNAAGAKRTLLDDTRELVERFGDQEFTVSHVEAALKKLGKASDAKNFKNRLSMLVRTLSDEGVIERTFEGSGKIPHKYRCVMKK
ncbi:hypothetical protein [Vibrio ziniensis]|uniref:Uncharacterized protein n=1 Tax=Vibrio ziniensis TaxID=2711221 RepID=A0A6G7CMX9_9VIBR|nr:hypothetical protein [Vibrio ziniensis]QIH43491.1 hypothetical protein G5S32_15960 [Vibrio ziniensis]